MIYHWLANIDLASQFTTAVLPHTSMCNYAWQLRDVGPNDGRSSHSLSYCFVLLVMPLAFVVIL